MAGVQEPLVVSGPSDSAARDIGQGPGQCGPPLEPSWENPPNHGASRAPFKAEDVHVGRAVDPGLINKLKG